jgi:glycosyltransferase involved in cell wall biosynthesis
MQEKRKIVIIGSAYPLRGGGISTFNERLAKAYQDQGNEVVLYTFSLQYPGLFFPGTTQYSKEDPPEGLNIKVTINSINPLSWWRTGKAIVKENPDLVVIRFWIPFMGPAFGTICKTIRRHDIPVVTIVDNIVPHERKPLDKQFARYFVNNVDCFITMSKAVLEDLEKFDTKKPKYLTVHPLYDNFGDPIPRMEALKRLNLTPDFQYILFFGFIREYKGLDLLIDAFADRRLRDFPVKLLVVGEFYSDPEPYKKQIQKHQLEDYVILHSEFVPNTEVVNYFCAANLVVQPYKDATQSGITQVAYHFDKPMITTNVGGLSEIIADNRVGFIVDPKSSSIADAMVNYFGRDLEGPFTKNVKAEKQRFSWDTMIEAIERVQKMNND